MLFTDYVGYYYSLTCSMLGQIEHSMNKIHTTTKSPLFISPIITNDEK